MPPKEKWASECKSIVDSLSKDPDAEAFLLPVAYEGQLSLINTPLWSPLAHTYMTPVHHCPEIFISIELGLWDYPKLIKNPMDLGTIKVLVCFRITTSNYYTQPHVMEYNININTEKSGKERI